MTRWAAVGAALAVLLAGPPAAFDPVRDAQWHLGHLNVAEAHKISQGEGVTVALLDTGVDAGHPDLTGNVLAGTDFSIDGPGDGLVDTDGHGTSMAGLIAADGRAHGVSPRAKVQSVRISASGFGGSSLSTAIDWAVDHGAQVVCIAFGGAFDTRGLRDTVTRALQADVVIVAAAGNTSSTSTVTPVVAHPGAYDGVIAAAAVNQNGNHDPVSVAGPEVVLVAPGKEIMSTYALSRGTGGYGVGTGTSASTAIIAGAAALVRSKYPNLSAAEVVHRLTATADDRDYPAATTSTATAWSTSSRPSLPTSLRSTPRPTPPPRTPPQPPPRRSAAIPAVAAERPCSSASSSSACCSPSADTSSGDGRSPPDGCNRSRPMRARIRHKSGLERRAVPPSDDWQVPKGLPPVIEPPAEPVRHDPGPGVIGIDR